MPSILIVDDLPAVHEMLDSVINPAGFDTFFSYSGEEALKAYMEKKTDIVLADISMEPMDGITLLKKIKAFDANARVILMTGYASTKSALEALKYGAFDYVQKPFRVDELVKTLKHAVASEKNEPLTQQEKPSGPKPDVSININDILAGQSTAIKAVGKQLEKLIRAEIPVFIQGEAGTGKRIIAEYIHKKSAFGKGPFKGVDCKLADQESLKESLINPDGSPGPLLQEVKKGTLFLNQIEAIPPALQEAIVHILQASESNFRFIFSSNISGETLVEKGEFSEAFFFRIATLPLVLPPLRDRKEDIPFLIKDLIQYTKNPWFDDPKIELSPEAREMIFAYNWPGNVVEFYNALSAVIASSSDCKIKGEMLPRRLQKKPGWPTLQEHLDTQKRAYLKDVLDFCDNDKGEAAKIADVKQNVFNISPK